jgi:hypothetical protein
MIRFVAVSLAGFWAFLLITLPIANRPVIATVSAANAAADAVQDFQPKAAETRVFYGTGSCKNCHFKGFEDADSYICRGTEMSIWQPQDKHALAFQVLGDERGQRIGKLLGLDVKNKKECLACHTAWFDEHVGMQKAGNFSREEGVSCVVCHGPDLVVLPGQDRLPKLGWLDTHGSQNQQFREAWRKLSRTVKQDEWGMTDLWDPVKRTQLCASCHIGNVEQGKVVTHEMYAAGHPPLPSFEVVTFSNQMPRHWQYLREKDKKVLDLVMKFEPSEIELEQTHLLAIGSLVVLRENLQLLANQAATKDWPELANYGCYACHHELRSKSWRQERGYAGKPGRPPLREWPTALVELGLLHAAANAEQAKALCDDFQNLLTALQTAVDSQPFGQSAAVKQKADDLISFINSSLKRIQDRMTLDESKGGYSPDASGQLLAQWLNRRAEVTPPLKANHPLPDFDSARQITWAYQVLSLEAASKHDPKTRQSLASAMAADPAWKTLDEYLGLTLPPGQIKLEASIKTGLDRIGNYDPRGFFKQWEAALQRFKVSR